MMWEGPKKAVWRSRALGVALVSVALAGCGGGSASVTSAIDLKSPGVQADGKLKPSVRCGWGSLWVPLEWGDVPGDTKELAIMLGRFKRVHGGGRRKVVVQFADLISKFKPTEHKLVANVLPEGVSWSFFGNNCVHPQGGQHLLLEVFALDRVRPRKMTRGLATRLTEEALSDSGSARGSHSPGELTEDAAAVGRLITTNYTGPH